MHSNVFQYSKIQTRKWNAKKSIKTVKNWNPALFGIRNPLYWNPESSTRNPESTAWNPESKEVLDSLTWGDTNYISELTLQTDYVSNTRLFRITRGKDRLMQIDKGGCTAGIKHGLCWQLVDWENGTRRCTPSKEEISCCLVDAKTAFDSVSHQWILIRTLEFYGLHNSVIHLINMP